MPEKTDAAIKPEDEYVVKTNQPADPKERFVWKPGDLVPGPAPKEEK